MFVKKGFIDMSGRVIYSLDSVLDSVLVVFFRSKWLMLLVRLSIVWFWIFL